MNIAQKTEDKSFLFKGKDQDMVVSSNLDIEFASY
jgi:hypothetical protein